MFRVEIRQKNHSWCKFTFKFETLEEAQQFVQSAVGHFVKEDEDDEDMVVSIEFSQRFSTTKEEENE